MFSASSIPNSGASTEANAAAGQDGSDMISQSLRTTIQGVGGRRGKRYTGMFYAYLFSTALSASNKSRMIITFASRTVADEWWRAVSTSDVPSLQNGIHRITPHLYAYDAHQFTLNNVFDTPELQAISDNFRGKMYAVEDGSPAITIIPTEPIVDHVSGSWYAYSEPEIPFYHIALTVFVSRFSIQSTNGPICYWSYYPGTPGGAPIRVNKIYNHRSLFKIWAPGIQEGAIMIDEDNIIIIIQHHGFLTLRPVDEKEGVHVVDVTIVEQEAASFKLRDFREGRFREIYDFGVGIQNKFFIGYSPHGRVSKQAEWELAT